MKFLYYFGRHGEMHLTEHSPRAWEFLLTEMQEDNRMTFDEAAKEFGPDCLYGSLEYREDAHLSMDDGGSIITIVLTEMK